MRRHERAERTRAHILESAAIAFAEGGYAATSLNAIVARSGLTKGAFYHYFDSKEELALSAFRHKQEELVTRSQASAVGAPDAPTALAAIFRERAMALREDPSMRAVLRLGAEFRALAAPDPEFVGFQELAFEALAGLLRRGQEEGTIRRELDARATAELVFGAIVGMDDVAHFLGGESLEERSERLVDLLLEGLVTDRRRPHKPREEHA